MAIVQKPTLNRSSVLVAIMALLGIAFSVVAGPSDIGDRVTITLKSGATYTGTIVAESASEISVLTEPDKIKVTIPKNLIAEIKLLKPKREEQTETETSAALEQVKQNRAGLLYAQFSYVISEQNQAYGPVVYGRTSPPTLSGPSIGAGYGYSKISDNITLVFSPSQDILVPGNFAQHLLFLSVARNSSNHAVLLGLYSAYGEFVGPCQLEPDCSWLGCYGRWLEVNLYTGLESLAIGWLEDGSAFVWGVWMVFPNRMNIHGTVLNCHEQLGCTAIAINMDNEMGIGFGVMLGLGFRW